MKQINAGSKNIIFIGKSCAIDGAKKLFKKEHSGFRVLIITDREVGGYYLATFKEMFADLEIITDTVIVEQGSQAKSLDALKPIFEKLIDLEMSRNDHIFILGGGTVIDIALFAINAYNISFKTTIIPTTLLSMVETGLMDKAYLNFQGYKDLLSMQLKEFNVIIDTQYLNTVPAKIITNGSAQIIQYGLTMNPHLLTLLSVPKDIAKIIETAIITGLKIRENEPKCLGFGRDIADAIEMHFRYYQYSSGEALALGMLAKCQSDKLKALYSRIGLPVLVEGATRETLIKRIEKSIKIKENNVEFIILDKAGKPSVELLDIENALKKYSKELSLICQ